MNNVDKKVIFENCALFTDCISEISDTHIDNAKDIDVVMPMYSWIKYSDNYLKTYRSLRKYYGDERALNAGGIIDFPDSNNSVSFKFKQKITGQSGNDGTKDTEKMVPLKYLRDFWRILLIPLNNCEIDLILTWLANCFMIAKAIENQVWRFTITDAKLYIPVVTLSTQDNINILDQLKSGFKRTIKY